MGLEVVYICPHHLLLVDVGVGALLRHEFDVSQSHEGIEVIICQVCDMTHLMRDLHILFKHSDECTYHVTDGVSFRIGFPGQHCAAQIHLHTAETREPVVVHAVELHTESVIAVQALDICSTVVKTQLHSLVGLLERCLHIRRPVVAHDDSFDFSALRQKDAFPAADHAAQVLE